jgi:hypothetical protein
MRLWVQFDEGHPGPNLLEMPIGMSRGGFANSWVIDEFLL